MQLSARSVGQTMHYNLRAETGHFNFSPVGFRLAARDFLRCAESFKPEFFSPVPLFLHCRAIELALKALHLETISQAARAHGQAAIARNARRPRRPPSIVRPAGRPWYVGACSSSTHR